jgi:hypothetical protein
MTSNKKNHSSCLPAFVLPIVAVALVIFAILIAGIYSLPSQAEKTFGPAGIHLSKQRMVYYSALLLLQKNDLTQPVDALGVKHPFTVAPGESTTSVVGRLWGAGLIKNPGAFRTYLYYTGLDVSLQAGDYQLSPAMTSMEIAHKMQDATPERVTFQILPGWR